MKKKLILALLCSTFTVANAHAKPNTLTITGKLVNNATTNINSPGWHYITARITLSDPNDTKYIKIAGNTMPPNGVYFDLYSNGPVEYQIDTTHLSGTTDVEFYDPNNNQVCTWYFIKGSSSATFVRGNVIYCSQKDNNLSMNE